MKQELGSQPDGGHISYGVTLKPAHKECVHGQNHLDCSFVKYCVGDSDKLSLIESHQLVFPAAQEQML